MGDIPIYVAFDSADVWARRHFFTVDADGHPETVAGVPPDYFSATGQLWGNPLCRWDVLAEDGYHWWVERMRMNTPGRADGNWEWRAREFHFSQEAAAGLRRLAVLTGRVPAAWAAPGS